jgi:hypothetical protein
MIRNLLPQSNDHPYVPTVRTSGRALMASFGDALLGVALAAEPRVDIDDDLQIMRDVMDQVTLICQDMAEQIRGYERSWRYWFAYCAAWLCWRSRWALDMRALDELDELVRRLPGSKADGYRTVQYYTRVGDSASVRRTCRVCLLSLWHNAGRCLSWWGDPR